MSEARLAVVETHVEYMREAIDEIRATQLEIRDQQLKAAAADQARKSVVVRIASVTGTAMGLVGSAAGWAISHGKLPLAIAMFVLLAAQPVPAEEQAPPVVGWYMKIKVCPAHGRKGICKWGKATMPGQLACEAKQRASLDLLPPGAVVEIECLVIRDETTPT